MFKKAVLFLLCLVFFTNVMGVVQIGLGLDLFGSYKQDKIKSLSVNTGFSPSLEILSAQGRHQLGLGMQWKIYRDINMDKIYYDYFDDSPQLSFIPVYITKKYLFDNFNKPRKWGWVCNIGYNSFKYDCKALDLVDLKTTGGLYFGAGIIINLKNSNLQLMYEENRGHVRVSIPGYEQSVRITNRQLNATFNIRFNKKKATSKIEEGMTRSMILKAWGSPDDIYTYSDNGYNYDEWDYKDYIIVIVGDYVKTVKKKG